MPINPRDRPSFGGSSYQTTPIRGYGGLPMPSLSGYETEEDSQPGWGDYAVTGALRTIPAVGLGIGGALVGGGLPGAAIGGAAGSGIGEWLAQQYEVARGYRPDVSGREIAAETALGGILSAVPGGRTIPRAIAWGIGQGAASPYLRAGLMGRDLSEVDPSEALIAGAIGGAAGGGLKYGLDRFQRAVARGENEPLLRQNPRLDEPIPVEPLPEPELGPAPIRPQMKLPPPEAQAGAYESIESFMARKRAEEAARPVRVPQTTEELARAKSGRLGELPPDQLIERPIPVEPLPAPEPMPEVTKRYRPDEPGENVTELGDIPYIQGNDGEPAHYYRVDPRLMTHRPEQYQIKSYTGKGSTGKLDDVKEWFVKAGEASPVILHETADGALNVVDGHQRTLLAQRLLAQGKDVPPLPSIVLKESEGWTTQEARRLGAMLNITSGTIDPVDVARVIRDRPIDELERRFIGGTKGPSGEAFRTGERLATLSDPVFQRVVRGEIHPYIGEAVARFKTPEEQLSALTALSRSDVRTPEEADALARRIAAAGFKEERTQDLFGEVFKLDPLVETAAELENAAARELSRGKSAFANLVRNESRLSDVVQGVDVQAAKGESQVLAKLRALLRKVSDAPDSATSRAINEGAAQVAAGGDRNLAMRNIMAAVEEDWGRIFGKEVRGGQVSAGPDRAVVQPVTPAGAGEAVPAVQPSPEVPAQLPQRGAAGRTLADQTGGIAVQPLAGIAGAGAGATYGYATGETPEERAQRAVGFGVAGAVAGFGGSAFAEKFARAKAAAGKVPAKAPAGKPLEPAGKLTPPRLVPREMAAQVAGERRTFNVSPAEQGKIPPKGKIPTSRLENVNLEYVLPEHRRDVARILEQNSYYEAERRGVQSNARTLEMAKRIAVELDRTLAKGTILNAEERTAYAITHANIAERKRRLLAEIDKIRKTTGNDPGDQLFELAKLETEHAVIIQSLSQNAAETGRALQAHKIAQRLMPGEIRVLMDAQKNANLRNEIQALEAALRKVDLEDPTAIFRAAKSAQTQTGFEKFTGYYLTNLLSGIQTQERNIYGTLTNMLAKNVLFPSVAAGLDVARVAVTGGQRQVFAGEVKERLLGMAYAWNKAIGDAGHVLKHGFSEDALKEMLELGQSIKFGRREFRGGGRNPFNWVGRGMDAADRFNFQLARSASLYALTYAEAAKVARAAGPIGSARYKNAIAKALVEQRSKVSRELWDKATLEGLENVYREPLGPTGKAFSEFKAKSPWMSYVTPFINTVSNIFKQGYEATPVSLAVKGAKALKQGSMQPFGKTVRDQEFMIAKGLSGTGMLLPMAWLAYSGQLSGSGPTDPAERAQLYETGWRPNSILLPLPKEIATAIGASPSDTGRYWVNYSLLQPFSVPLSMLANAFDAYRNVQSRTEKSTKLRTVTGTGAQFVQGVARSAMSQSYLQGASALFEAVNADDMSAELWINNFAKSLLPFSGLLRNVTRAVDPTLRQPRGVWEAVQTNIPGMSQRVAPRLTRWGEPTQLSGTALRRFAGIPEVEPQVSDPVDDELARLGIAVGRPTERLDMRDIEGKRVQVPPEIGNLLREVRGKVHRAGMIDLMGTDQYQSAPDVIKIMMVRSVLSSTSRDASEAVKAAIQLGQPELARVFLQPYLDASRGQ